MTTIPISSLINTYVANRDQFLSAGGAQFVEDRQALRADYCRSNVSKKALNQFIGEIHTDAARAEFRRRFAEWDRKIERGQLQKLANPTLSGDAFIAKVDAFSAKYRLLIQSECYRAFTDAKATLRDAMLSELKSMTAEQAAQKHSISDSELISRMKNEWSWKTENTRSFTLFQNMWKRVFG